MFPQVTSIHFLSDSPSTQYRNKTMFAIIGKELPKVNVITWNYSESGHGKGAPDEVGGIIKRIADRCVAQGEEDIHDFLLLHVLGKNLSDIDIFAVPYT